MSDRRSGILLHITSLPSPFGIGDVGPSAYRFVDFLHDAHQRYWQILPLNQTTLTHDNSPYLSTSAFAGNTNLISPEQLVKDGLLKINDIRNPPDFPQDHVDFEPVIRYKNTLFSTAYERFRNTNKSHREYEAFCRNNALWLEDYALFRSLSRYYGKAAWSDWPGDLKYRQKRRMEAMRTELNNEIGREQFLQYVFYRQWMMFRQYCTEKGIRILGDIPIYVNYNSADVWTHPELFRLDAHRRPTAVAGVPPDYFSKTGQLWKNPLYCWEEHEKTGFSWWLDRLRHTFSLVDCVRIDHFRGFVEYWEVPAGSKDAIFGRWVPAPAEKLLTAVRNHFPEFPVIAEDLGIITKDVNEIIRKFNLPGMRVLLFAFTSEPFGNPHIPHNLSKNVILYTGTHDNLPVRGWFETAATDDDKRRLFKYLGREVTAEELPQVLIRLAMMSVADTVIFPIQDIISLGAEARMNTPGTDNGNWTWRMTQDQITPKVAEQLRDMTGIFNRG
jgi:4-alpha-glucanotransferase